MPNSVYMLVVIVSVDKGFALFFYVHILIRNVPTRTIKLNFGDNGDFLVWMMSVYKEGPGKEDFRIPFGRSSYRTLFPLCFQSP